jgi:uncharacterized protein
MTDQEKVLPSSSAYCSNCGRPLEANGCPYCSPSYAAQPSAPIAPPRSAWWDVLWAMLVWGVSGGVLLTAELLFRIYLWRSGQPMPNVQLTPAIVLASLAVTLFMQLAGLLGAWLLVTRVGKQPFWKNLGWTWHPRFRWWHAVGLALVMMGAAVLFERVLPHRETELEKILKMGFAVRLAVAALAVLTAPLIEEVVYRGVVFLSIERVLGKWSAVVFVTLLFAGVHAPQYWNSYAALTAILSLSLVLTLLRAWTNSLLPCVATHLIYNGIQAVVLLFAPEKAPEPNPVPEPVPGALMILWQWLSNVCSITTGA